VADLPPDVQIVVGYANKIGTILFAGGALALVAIGTRALGLDKIKYESLDVPLSWLWTIFMAGTLFHVLYARSIIDRLVELHYDDKSQRKADAVARGQQVFDGIRTSSNPVLQGLMPRTEPTRPRSRIVRMSLKDFTAKVSLGLVLVTVVALLPWRIDHGLRFAPLPVSIAYGAIAAIIVGLNWWVGGYWIIRVSHFKDNDIVDGLKKPFVDLSYSSGFGFVPAPAQNRVGKILFCSLLGILAAALIVVFVIF